MAKQKIICIGGPTGVGKTDLAIRIAKQFNGEIVSCDSIAIYKHLNIGSAKPTSLEQSMAKHYMIDIAEPTDTYSVAEYCANAKKIIKEIQNRGKLPIIVGGTGLYMKGLLFPMDFGHSERSQELREKYKKIAEEKGGQYLLDYLSTFDKESADKLHEKDTLRIIRAIEIYELTNKPKSQYKNNLESEFNFMLLFLNTNRKKLYERIDTRVEKMFNLGLEEEVKNLVKTYNLTSSSQSMEAIGYKEFFDYFDKKISKEQLVEQIKLDSRHYAKRQITWFKKMPNNIECNIENIENIVEKVKIFLNE